MMIFKESCFLILITSLCCSSFVIKLRDSHKHAQLFLVSSSDETTNSQQSSQQSSLQFDARKTFISDPLMVDDSKSLNDFLQREDAQKIMLGGNSGNDIKSLDMDEKYDRLLGQWVTQYESFGFETLPNPNPTIYSVSTQGVQFPGIKLKTNVFIGVTVVQDPSLECRVILIQSEQMAEGLKPLVWIFEKLTGGGSNNEKSKNQQSSRALTKISIQPTADNNFFSFSFESMLSVKVNFPSALLKILPVSKGKAEEQGSASLMKVLEKDTAAALPLVCEFYSNWLEM